jgi:peptidoglycan/xylan/chitin deacetylase (PgdA/CDA1 family)
VVLTIDDGYRSVYEIAYPVLKKYQYPATVFIYSDYIANGGLSWDQMKEMEASGLFSFQPHSKTHDNLTVMLDVETVDDYKARLVDEIRVPGQLLGKRMKTEVFGYAYPFGAVNRHVVEELERQGYTIGVTVDRGGNPFFAYAYTLRRTMIYETDGLEEFKQALQVFDSRQLK